MVKCKHSVQHILQHHINHLSHLSFTSWHLRTLHALRKCRTLELGGHIDKCNCCNNIHISYNSCRNRHCPQCQGHKREEWIAAREKEILPVPYFHVVFTLPHELNPTVLKHPSVIYKFLFKAAWDTLNTFGKKELQAQIGMIAVLHTWGQNLSLHPHLHCIVPAGGAITSGKWKHAKFKRKFLFPVKALSKMFRAKFVHLLRKSPLKIDQSLYDILFSKKWVIYAKKPFGKPQHVIEYLGRYSHKVAISNHRILEVNKFKNIVKFSAKNYRNGGKNTIIQLSTIDFIRRFQLHILPKGFTRMRHYGCLSSSWKKDKLPKIQAQLSGSTFIVSQLNKPQKLSSLLRKCPKCKKGTLITIAEFSGRGPPKSQILMLLTQYAYV